VRSNICRSGSVATTPSAFTVGKKRISLEQLRKVLGLESVKDADGNVIKDAPLPTKELPIKPLLLSKPF